MDRYNLENLVRVRVNGFWKSKWYFYFTHKPKKYFWQIERKEGVYRHLISMEYYSKDVPENHTLIDGEIYENPEVIMFFQGGQKAIKYFENTKDANAFAEKITKGKNWLCN